MPIYYFIIIKKKKSKICLKELFWNSLIFYYLNTKTKLGNYQNDLLVQINGD